MFTSCCIAVLLEVFAPAVTDLRLDGFFEGVGSRAVALAVVDGGRDLVADLF